MSIAMPAVEQPHDAFTGDQAGATSSQHEYVMPNGRVRVDGLTEADRGCAVALHLSPIASFFIGPFGLIAPLIIWLVRKDRSTFNNDHGKESINFVITYVLVSFLLAITIIGPFILMIIALINMIRGALAGGRGEYFRYPMTIRFLS
jgi:uncharacterized protein